MSIVESQRTYFNQLAHAWNIQVPEEPRVKSLLSRFGISFGEWVLDVGAGTGRTTKWISQMVGDQGKVIALDFAEAMLKEAKAMELFNGSLVCGDVHFLPFREACFDKIVCFSAFPHFSNKEKAIREMHRILKPKGRCLILHTLSHDRLNAFHASLEGPVRKDVLPSIDTAAQLFYRAGFYVEFSEESEDLYWLECIRP